MEPRPKARSGGRRSGPVQAAAGPLQLFLGGPERAAAAQDRGEAVDDVGAQAPAGAGRDASGGVEGRNGV